MYFAPDPGDHWNWNQMDEEDRKRWLEKTGCRSINDDRNYEWFGIVGDVRRHYDLGYADRGIPDDASEHWRNTCESWGLDMHSQTWLSRPEVREANGHYGETWERIPTRKTIVRFLTLVPCDSDAWGDDSWEGRDITWNDTLGKLLGRRKIDENIRYVIGFDN